jgi:integrase
MSVKVRERPKGSGIWWIFIDHQGKRKAKKIGKDKRFAHEVAKKIEARLVLGDLKLDGDSESNYPLFKDYAHIWLTTYIKQMRRQSTYERYKDALSKYVIPVLGKKPINEIRRGEVRNLLMTIYSRGLSRSYIGIIYATINGPLTYALDEELIMANPIIGLTKRLGAKTEENDAADFLSREEVNLFLTTCYQHFNDYYPLFLCAFRTGLRLGELLGLQWGDMDWNGNFIEVRRSYKIGKVGPTKTGKNRRVDISDQLMATLRSLYSKRQAEALAEGRGEVVKAIFHRDGKQIEQNFIRRIFKRILIKAGIREIRFHDIRHTYASLLLSNGESPVYVKEQLGHTSIQMTVDIYGHLIPGSNRQAVNRLDTRHYATYTQLQKKM